MGWEWFSAAEGGGYAWDAAGGWRYNSIPPRWDPTGGWRHDAAGGWQWVPLEFDHPQPDRSPSPAAKRQRRS